MQELSDWGMIPKEFSFSFSSITYTLIHIIPILKDVYRKFSFVQKKNK